MGNQQERSLSWLAGILDGEGSISFQVCTKPNGNIMIQPYVCIVNTDLEILRHSKEILDDILKDHKGSKARFCGHGGTNKPCHIIRVDGTGCAIVVKTMIPYLRSTKKRNAEKVLEYLELRKQRLLLRNELGQVTRQGYRSDEIDIICSVRTHSRAKSSETIRQAANYIG